MTEERKTLTDKLAETSILKGDAISSLTPKEKALIIQKILFEHLLGIETKTEANYAIDWIEREGYRDRLLYFKMLRAFIRDLKDLSTLALVEKTDIKREDLERVFSKHSVYFIDLPGDAFPRVNLDIPLGCQNHGDR